MRTNRPLRLTDLPLWRLLVALDDAERFGGPDSPTARALARALQDRLRSRRKNTKSVRGEPHLEMESSHAD